MSLLEEDRCKLCGACKNSCPAGIKPNEMIRFYKLHDYVNLAKSMYDTNPFALTCGNICQAPCMNDCIFNKVNTPINIKKIQNICAHDFGKYLPKMNTSNKIKGKCAVVGAGISGLTTAWYLNKHNYIVDVFEKSDKVGGEINLIPSNRLKYSDFKYDCDMILRQQNINIFLNTIFDINLENNYDHIFYCCGCEPKRLHIINDELACTYVNYLSETEHNENIAIIGGGNVALDCTLVNKGNSTIFIRRNLWNMKIDKKDFEYLNNNKIRVISNFIPTHLLRESNNKFAICGNMDNNNIRISNFDKIIYAIGKEQIIPNTKKGIIIKSSNTVVETVGNTVKQLKEYFQKKALQIK